MSIKLAANERVIKTYNYAKTREGIINKRITNNTLIVTNKRVIKKDVCDKEGYQKTTITQIPTRAISGINARATSGFKFIFLVLGIVFALAGFINLISSVFGNSRAAAGIVLFLIFGGLSGLFFYLFKTKRINSVTCTFTVSERINTAMGVGAFTFNSATSRFKVSGASSFFRIFVNASEAYAIVEEIGAIIADIQDGVYDTVLSEEPEELDSDKINLEG